MPPSLIKWCTPKEYVVHNFFKISYLASDMKYLHKDKGEGRAPSGIRVGCGIMVGGGEVRE